MGCELCGMPCDNASGWCGIHTGVVIDLETGRIIEVLDLRYEPPLFYIVKP